MNTSGPQPIDHDSGAHQAGPVELLRAPYPGDSTREVVLIRATFAPGENTPPHRHPGLVLGYVLSGEYEFQLEGESLQQLKAGQAFFEPPHKMHVVSRNAGDKPSQVLAFIVRERGAGIMIPLA